MPPKNLKRSLQKITKKVDPNDENYTSDESDQVDEKPAQSIDFSRIWLTVKQKPHDFTSWCTLLQLSEQENKLGLIRKAFTEFFKHYPYTYAYWKKFADLERRHGHNYHAKRVVKRAIAENPMSVDLWIYTCELYTSRYLAEYQHLQSKKRREEDKKKKEKKEQDEEDWSDDDEGRKKEDGDEKEPDVADVYAGKDSKDKIYDDGHATGLLNDARVEKIRKLYWRAVENAGRQFKAGRLWTKFVYFERQQGSISKVLPIYQEILRIPMEDYNQHFTDMKEFVMDSADPCELIDDTELADICREHLEDINANLGIGDQGDQAYRLAKAGELSEDALDRIRNVIIDQRRDTFKECERLVARIWNFEDSIKRPYFHVKPLDKAQLKNWIEYLDYEIESGTSDRNIRNLFERCVVACALYEDIWLKFANWAEHKAKDIPLARENYRRCCKIHLPKRANCRLEWATFEERHNRLDDARLILEDLSDRIPGLLAVSARLFHLKRRAGKMTSEQLVAALKTEWANAQEFRERDGIEKEQFWACELAWYLCKENRIAEARMVLDSGIERSPHAARIYRVRAEIESYNKTLYGWLERLCEVYEKAAKCEKMDMESRVAFSGHLYGILERESSDMQKISAAYDLHRTLRKELQREGIRIQKADNEENMYDPANPTNVKRIGREGGGGGSFAPDGSKFINPHRDNTPKIATNVSSTRVADYTEVGGSYHTYQSQGAYGNSYTWTYSKGAT